MSYNHHLLVHHLNVLLRILKLLFTSETVASGGCLTNREALTVLCSVIKHAGSG